MRIENQTLGWRYNHISYRRDDKHAQTIIRAPGLRDEPKGDDVPLDWETPQGDMEELNRRVVEGAGADRQPLGAGPPGPSARRPKVTLAYYDAKMDQMGEVIAWSDGDGVGRQETRRSVSGGVRDMGNPSSDRRSVKR